MSFLSAEVLVGNVMDAGDTVTIPSGSDRFLVLTFVTGYASQSEFDATITMGGQTLTRLIDAQHYPGNTGAAHGVYTATETQIAAMSDGAITAFASSTISGGAAVWYEDIDQTAGVINTVTDTTDDDPRTVTLTGIASGDIVIGVTSDINTAAATPASTTLRATAPSDNTGNPSGQQIVVERIASSASEAFIVDHYTGPYAATSMLALRPASATSTPRITTAQLPNGVVGEAYSQTVSVNTDGGTAAATAWTVSSGSLPSGITIADASAATLTLSGTPTASGRSTFVIQYENADGGTDTQELTIAVDPLIKYGYTLQVT